MSADYAAFLAGKVTRASPAGFTPAPMPPHMTGHWEAAARTCIERGRCAAFLDTGLGKTTVELEFARQVAERTGKPSLILSPLAVAAQIAREASKFGYDARVIRDMGGVSAQISVCNYDRLDHLDALDFGAVVLDESGILKSFSGRTANALIEKFSRTPYRMAATATPAPNDHMELGQHADFLGVMSSAEMLARWFKNDTDTASQTWRLKGHAVRDFWDWVASWAVMAETPEDLGFDGSSFVLPPMKIIRHKIGGDIRKPIGGLFAEDVSAITMHTVKRQTAEDRAAAVAALVTAEPDEPWLIWCDADYESSALAKLVPSCSVVKGSDAPETKERLLNGFQDGRVNRLITKPSIAGHGMNFQQCARVAFVGRSFSYELWYQAVRRCWRFGQTRPVHVHLIVAEGEAQIGRVIDRKAEGHAEMRAAMRNAQRRSNGQSVVNKVPYYPTHDGRIPAWLSAA
jgi:hypothetical protein